MAHRDILDAMGDRYGTQWQLPAFWATQEEDKLKPVRVQENREQRVIHLATQADKKSVSSGTYKLWDLNRGKTRKILKHLENGRALQTAFGNLIGATRFKTLEKGILLGTPCQRCKRPDSWGRC